MPIVLTLVALAFLTVAFGVLFKEKFAAGISGHRNRKRIEQVSEPSQVEELQRSAEKVVMIRTMAASGGQTGGGPDLPSFESFVVTKEQNTVDLYIGQDHIEIEQMSRRFAKKLGVPFQDTSYGVLDPELVTENFEAAGGLTLGEEVRGELSMAALEGGLSEASLSGKSADHDDLEIKSESVTEHEIIES